MNKDFRISVTIATHCKTKKLMRRLGDRSFYNLIRLWAYIAANKPDGKLTGMNEEDIEIAADWNGQCSEFVLALLELKFIDKTDDIFSIHNWEKHNGYAFHAQQRSEKAQKAAEVRWKKRNENKDIVLSNATSNAISNAEQCPSPVPTPAPSPKPSPKPSIKEKDSSELKNSSEPIVSIPLVNKTDYPIYHKDITAWQRSYPAVDILQAVRSIREWNLSNPTKQKTPKGIRRHITTWLDKEQNKGGQHGRFQSNIGKSSERTGSQREETAKYSGIGKTMLTE